jgi:uncharacterized protein YndB with AHSA1/START domain
MTVRTIEQSTEIVAPRQRVWDVMLHDETYRQWTAEFMEGSYAETDWQPGSKAVFRDPAGNGMIGRIVASIQPELVEIEYDGVLVEGREDYESAEAGETKGTREVYRLSERDGRTLLTIQADMAEAYFPGMAEAWKRALNRLKALAEST